MGDYQCAVCGVMKEHVTTLCPWNSDPGSLTQLRLKYRTTHHSSLEQQAESSPAYFKKEVEGQKHQRQMASGAPDVLMHEDRRRAIMELDEGQITDEDSFESRYTQAKRNYSTQHSPQVNPSYGPKSFSTSPAPKRSRTNDTEQCIDRERDGASGYDYDPKAGRTRRDQESRIRFVSPGHNREQGYYHDPEGTRGHTRDAGRVQDDRDHSVPRGRGRYNSGSYGSTHDLLPNMNCRRSDKGRLSYWNNEYSLKENTPPKYQTSILSSDSSRSEQQPLSNYSLCHSNREQEIQQLHPNADLAWVQEMASHDVDAFLDKITIPKCHVAFEAEAVVSNMDTIPDHSGNKNHSPRDSACISPCASPYLEDRFLENRGGPGTLRIHGSLVKHSSEALRQAGEDDNAELEGHQRTLMGKDGKFDSKPSVPKSLSPPSTAWSDERATQAPFAIGSPEQRVSSVHQNMPGSIKMNGTKNDMNVTDQEPTGVLLNSNGHTA